MDPSVLVGMLSSGENEREQAIAALKAQRFKSWELLTFDGLPNKQGHDELYQTFMAEAENFSHFLKLDADMVFRRDTGLEEILEVFRQTPGLDWLMLDVHDWYSNTLIPGLNAFSNRAYWSANADLLMVDHAPRFPGSSLRLSQRPAPVVDHSPNPSNIQAFRFGVHRALKALQPDRESATRQIDKAMVHWLIIDYVWRHYRANPDRRLALVTAGAEFVMGGGSGPFGHDYMHPDLERLFQARFEPMTMQELLSFIGETWDTPLANQSRYLAQLHK